jgi:2-C-methyl-D-erythritol 4-phosphate cytidylyltransferase
MVYALIVAGGKGTRFAGHTLKQYLPLAGVPILTRTLRVFDDCEVIDRLVVAVPPPDIGFVHDAILSPAALRKPIQIIAGGRRRQDSVFKGLAAIDPDESLVVIHDAVRPLVSRETITACVNTAQQHGACIAALPVWDTLKRTTAAGVIEATLPRERVWQAQTPQAFRTRLIRQAHECARRDGFLGTDDAGLAERMGMTVHVCRGSRRNIKITTAEDLSLAEVLLTISETDARGPR